MNASGSAGNGPEDNNNSRIVQVQVLRWNRRRYRDRIWCMSPEAWLALGFFLLVMGLSLLKTGYFYTSDADRDSVMKFGAFVLCSGWATLIFLVERVMSRNWCSRLYTHNSCPEFVGVCIGPPIQPEFLSAMLLPEIAREWVSAESLPGFKSRHAEIVRPPKQQATAEEENGEESRSKRRRNRKKKVNNSISELLSASQESNETNILQIATVDTNQEGSQSSDLRTDGELPSKVLKQKSKQEHTPNQYTDKKNLQESSQPTELNQASENLNKLISQEKNHFKYQNQASNHQPSSRLNDSSNTDNAFAADKVVKESAASNHQHNDLLQTANGLMSEELYLESVKTTSLVSVEDQQDKLELTFKSPNQDSVENNSEKLNTTPVHLSNITKPESIIPKGSEKPAEEAMPSDTTSSEMQQVDSKPVSPDFITFTSKKRNRRRKK